MARGDSRRASGDRPQNVATYYDNASNASGYSGMRTPVEYYAESPGWSPGPGESSVLSPGDGLRLASGGSPSVENTSSRASRTSPKRSKVSPKNIPLAAPNLRAKTRFEGQASYARDYTAPPREALLEAFPARQEEAGSQCAVNRSTLKPESAIKGIRPPFEGDSRYAKDFKKPPVEALNNTSLQAKTPKHELGRRPPFEGVSMNRRDFVAPPQEVYRQNRVNTGNKDKAPGKEGQIDGRRPPFEGDSMARRDFVHPPREAYKQNSYQNKSVADAHAATKSKERPPFEGDTSQRRDYVPPPSDAYKNGSSEAGGQTQKIAAQKKASARFEGDSQMRRDFVPPPRQAYLDSRGALSSEKAASAVKKSRFEGESMARSHYIAPPKEAYLADW